MQDERRTTRRDLIRAGTAGVAGLAAGSVLSAAEARSNTRSMKIDTRLGKHVLEFDFPGLEIGSAIYPDGPTGCTVFHFPKGATGVADARGGAVCTTFTDRMQDGARHVDAICFAGGSVYGLEAAAGVSSGLFERRGHATDWNRIALVSGAILFDFVARKNAIYPDARLGRAALDAAKPGVFPLGGRGAGVSATCGKWLIHTTEKELAGQGGAVRQRGPTRVAVFTVVNSLGAIVDRDGTVVRGHRDPRTGKRVPVPKMGESADKPKGGNTTLTLVVTNQRLGAHDLRQLAREVHTAMARVIVPFHTSSDGDVLFAVTTNAVTNRSTNTFQLGAVASDCALDAVLRSFAGR